MGLNHIIEQITHIEQKYLIVFLSAILLTLNSFENTNKLITQIIITTIVLAIFEVFLKKIILFKNTNEYYIFIINNTISIVVINLLTFLINSNLTKDNFISLFYIAFACLFYELIVFKLNNYNNLGNQKLREMTKIIMRLTTINILYRFLQNEPYDKFWFDKSLSQLFNFLLFTSIFEK